MGPQRSQSSGWGDLSWKRNGGPDGFLGRKRHFSGSDFVCSKKSYKADVVMKVFTGSVCPQGSVRMDDVCLVAHCINGRWLVGWVVAMRFRVTRRGFTCKSAGTVHSS